MVDTVPGAIGSVVAPAIVLFVLSSLTTALRFWARSLLPEARFWWDDWTILLAQVAFTPLTSLVFTGALRGLGTAYAVNLTRPELDAAFQIEYIGNALGAVLIAIPKISVTFFFERAFCFKGYDRRRYILWAFQAVLVSVMIANVLSIVIICEKEKKEDPNPAMPGYCLSRGGWFPVFAIMSFLLDAFILIFPLPILWKLQMKSGKKLALAGVFTIGWGVAAVSLVRLILTAVNGPTIWNDTTWNARTNAILVGTVEPAVSIIGANLPSLFTLYKRGKEHGWSALFHRTTAAEERAALANRRAMSECWPSPSDSDASSAEDSFKYTKMSTRATARSSYGRTKEKDVPIDAIGVRRDVSVTP